MSFPKERDVKKSNEGNTDNSKRIMETRLHVLIQTRRRSYAFGNEICIQTKQTFEIFIFGQVCKRHGGKFARSGKIGA